MRKQEWPLILSQKIEENKNVPFVWGWSDCLQFAIGVAAAMVDYDLFLKGNKAAYDYDTEEGAKEILDTFFEGDMSYVFDGLFEAVKPAKAQRGDIVIVEFMGKDICGIVDSSGRAAACKSNDGLLFVPIRKAVKAWRVE